MIYRGTFASMWIWAGSRSPTITSITRHEYDRKQTELLPKVPLIPASKYQPGSCSSALLVCFVLVHSTDTPNSSKGVKGPQGLTKYEQCQQSTHNLTGLGRGCQISSRQKLIIICIYYLDLILFYASFNWNKRTGGFRITYFSSFTK